MSKQKKPAARAALRSSETRRARYLRVARELFSEHGFAGTSTDMIVARAGGSKATLYKHFPSKGALVEGLITEVISRVEPEQLATESADLPLREALVRIATAVLRGVVSETAVSVLRLVLGEYKRFPELARAVWDHGPTITYRNFVRFIEHRRSLGELAFDDSQLAAEHFLAGNVGHIQLKVALGIAEAPDEPEIARRANAIVDTFLARYATAPPAEGEDTE